MRGGGQRARPSVKYIEDRTRTSPHPVRPGRNLRCRRPPTSRGDILGLKVKMIIDTAGYPGWQRPAFMVEAMLPSAYKIGALEFQFTAVVTNKAPYVAYRGPGRPRRASGSGYRPGCTRTRHGTTGGPPPQRGPGRGPAGVHDHRSQPGRDHDGSRITRTRSPSSSTAGVPPAPEAEAWLDGRYIGIGVASYIEAAPGPDRGR